MSARKRIAELRDQIREADHLYYNEGRPTLTDAEYDALFVELRELEAEHPELADPDSPTVRVGAPLPKGSGFAKAQHVAPMLSIESLHTIDDVTEFVDRARRHLEMEEDDPLHWTVEPKFDGVSASLLYENGELVRGLSRGDGTTGEEITQNLRTIRSLPLRLLGDGPFPERIEVRGEVIMTRDAFARMQQQAETTTDTPFRNARNSVAGTLKLMDPKIAARRPMEFIFWGVGDVQGFEVETYDQIVEHIRDWGFHTSPWFEVVTGPEGIAAFHQRLESERDDIQYEMDGIVAKVQRIDLQRRLGRTARAPRWILAFKFAPRRALTKVDSIAVQVGRTGAVTPVAELAPVELAGVTVRRATLHNFGLLAERDVRVGDEVEIERAGDVIPEVVKVFEDKRGRGSKAFVAPSECPVCSSQLEEEGAFLYCVNVECPAQIKGRIVHMAARRALDIDRLGPKYVDQLLEAGLIEHPEDIFTLPDRKDEILALERWGQKSFDRLTEELQKAKTPELHRFIHALGIRHVGEQTARDLAEAIETLEEIEAADEEQLIQVEGVGPEVAQSIRRFFALPGNKRFLQALRDNGLEIRKRESRAGSLTGRIFCFTGGLQTMTRDQAKALAEEHGAKTTSSISNKITDVVLGEGAGAKAEKAKKLELNLLDEQEFLALVGRT